MRSTALAVGASFGVAASVACYAYVPVSTRTPDVGERVRVHLSATGTEDLAKYLGPRITTAEGTLQSLQADGTLVVGVDWVQNQDGNGQAWNGQEAVSIPKLDMTEVELRTLDRRRSALFGVGLATALVAAAITAIKSAGSGGSPGSVGGTTPP